jgi:hypothetical protein
MLMPQSPDTESILWVTRSRRPQKHAGLGHAFPDPPKPLENASVGSGPEPSAAPEAPLDPADTATRRRRIIVPIFLTVAIACFTLAVLAGAVLHYLFVTYLLSWTDFFLLAGAAITFGHLGGRVLTALGERVRRESQ